MITPATPNRSATNAGANSFQSFVQATTGTAATILAYRQTRRAAIITNLDGTNAAQIGASTVTGTTGYTLPAGASISISATAAVYVIDNGNHVNLTVWEEWD